MTSDESIKRYIKDLRDRKDKEIREMLNSLGFTKEKIDELMK